METDSSKVSGRNLSGLIASRLQPGLLDSRLPSSHRASHRRKGDDAPPRPAQRQVTRKAAGPARWKLQALRREALTTRSTRGRRGVKPPARGQRDHRAAASRARTDRPGVLERHGRALRQERQYGMGGIAGEQHAARVQGASSGAAGRVPSGASGSRARGGSEPERARPCQRGRWAVSPALSKPASALRLADDDDEVERRRRPRRDTARHGHPGRARARHPRWRRPWPAASASSARQAV